MLRSAVTETPSTPFAKLGKQIPWARPFLPIRRLDRIYAGALAHPERKRL